MTALDTFITDNKRNLPDANGEWIDCVIDKKLVENLISKVDATELTDLIQHGSAEIEAINANFFKFMENDKKEKLRKKIVALLLAITAQNARKDIYHLEIDTDFERRCKALLTLLNDPLHSEAKKLLVKQPPITPIEKIQKASLEFYNALIEFNIRDALTDFIDNPLPKLYVLSKQTEDFISFVHSERVGWAFDDTTPLYAAKGIIDATRYNPAGYDYSLATKNLDKLAPITGQLSWIAPTAAVFLQAFQMGIEAKYYKDKHAQEEAWWAQFWAQIPEAMKHKLYVNLLWSIVNTLSFWLSFGLGGSTNLSKNFSVDSLGLVINIAGMLYQLGLQTYQWMKLNQEINKKITELEPLKQSSPTLENKQQQKALSNEIRELQFKNRTLLAEISTVTVGIIAGMILMTLGPFAPILPAIGAIVNSAVILLCIIIQHSLKLYTTSQYKDSLMQELEEKNALFTGEDNPQQHLLFLEILTLENDIANQEYLYNTQVKTFIRTLLVKLCMQLVIFFAISLAPLSIALVTIGLGILEAKLLEFITGLMNPEPSPKEIPELNGGYVLCDNKTDITDKKTFIEVVGDNITLHFKEPNATDPTNFTMKISENSSLKGITQAETAKYFTKILAIAASKLVPGATDFDKQFTERKAAKLSAVNTVLDSPQAPPIGAHI